MGSEAFSTETVKASLNFAADKDGGRFSNTNPSVSRQNLVSMEVDVANIRTLRHKPALDVEGFVIAAHSPGRAAWSDQEWLDKAYVPSCVELIKNLTGAKKVLSLYFPMIRRVNYADYQGAAPAAHFVHLDMPRQACRTQADMHAQSVGVTFRGGTIYNVWKAITPPPQDVPLAICDRRTLSERDFAIGTTVEGDIEVPHVTILSSARDAKWFYAPDLTMDESLVFVGGDMDDCHSLGCAHSAFKHPVLHPHSVPRASIEVRILVCDD